MGISVTDETLERATRVKRLIGRPQESAQSERKSTTRYSEEPNYVIIFDYKGRIKVINVLILATGEWLL
ncbi:hypothetical protein [Lysinibacillus sp. RS10]|uniref:hypothetical protein n=1 Tax=Lysinibacillus sp. RS10 TaxID=3242678 RepID=UPI0035BF8547